MKWLLFLLWDPVKALDLETNGKVAYGKVGGLFSFLALYALAWYEALRGEGSLSWTKWTILWASIFGLLGLRAWFAYRMKEKE